MSYIGQQPVVGRYILLDQISGGFNGTATGFTMAAGGQGVLPGLAQNVLLSLGGVIQQPGVDYLISGSGLTFTTAPVSGTTFFATVLGDMQAVGTPSDGTVLPASIASSGTFVFPNVTTTGTTLIASGTAAAPSLAVIGDVNTGLYSPGADQLALSTGGTGRLFVDASGRVGIGTTSPGEKLAVVDSGVVYTSLTGQSTTLYSYAANIGCGFFLNAALPLTFGTNALERARIDSSGRLGIGTSSPATKLEIYNTGVYGTTYQPSLYLTNSSSGGSTSSQTGLGAIGWRIDSAYDVANIEAVRENPNNGTFSALVFRTNGANVSTGAGTERMRIDSGGNIITHGTIFRTFSGATVAQYAYDAGTGLPAAGQIVISCKGNDGAGGSSGVGLTRAATSWSAYSDERAKADLVPIIDGLNKVSTLRSVTGRYNDDEPGTSRSFLVAQDVQAVLPEAVDASNPDKLSLRYTETIPLLVAALKEAKERIETLEAKVAALEGV